jgi:hypothetical protein
MSCPLLGADVRTKIGVLVTVASMIASAPTSWWYRNVSVQEEKRIKKANLSSAGGTGGQIKPNLSHSEHK